MNLNNKNNCISSNYLELVFYMLMLIEFVLNFNFSFNHGAKFYFTNTLSNILVNYLIGDCYGDYYDYLLFPLIVLSIIILNKNKKDKGFTFYKHTLLFSKIFIFLGVIRLIYELLLPTISGPVF